jgi:hypothetical protein
VNILLGARMQGCRVHFCWPGECQFLNQGSGICRSKATRVCETLTAPEVITWRGTPYTWSMDMMFLSSCHAHCRLPCGCGPRAKWPPAAQTLMRFITHRHPAKGAPVDLWIKQYHLMRVKRNRYLNSKWAEKPFLEPFRQVPWL